MRTVPTQTLTPQQAARARVCGICWQRPGLPCSLPGQPEADHLKRYLDAYQAGEVSRGDMAAVFAAVEVVTRHRLVPAEVTSWT